MNQPDVPQPAPTQFSIGHLLAATAWAAICLACWRWEPGVGLALTVLSAAAGLGLQGHRRRVASEGGIAATLMACLLATAGPPCLLVNHVVFPYLPMFWGMVLVYVFPFGLLLFASQVLLVRLAFSHELWKAMSGLGLLAAISLFEVACAWQVRNGWIALALAE